MVKEKTKEQLQEEYNRVNDAAWDEYNEIQQKAKQEQMDKIVEAEKAYRRIANPAWRKCKKTTEEAQHKLNCGLYKKGVKRGNVCEGMKDGLLPSTEPFRERGCEFSND